MNLSMSSMKPSLLFLPPARYPLCCPVSLKPIRTTNSSSSSPAISCINEAADRGGSLTARERRQLRQERRESNKTDSNWREEIEERLILEKKKRKKNQETRAQKLSVNTLTELGPQWWALRVSRNRSHETAVRLSQFLKSHFPNLQIKIYNPSIIEKKKSKDGFLSVESKPLIPGTMYIHFTMHRLVHDAVKGFKGVVSFVGTEIEVSKNQYFVKPRPIDIEEMEKTLKRQKEEQEKVDRAFKEKLGRNKTSKGRVEVNDEPNLLPGVNVRVLSGPFADYTGCVKELDLKKRKANVEVLLFGKKSNVELDIDQVDTVNA